MADMASATAGRSIRRRVLAGAVVALLAGAGCGTTHAIGRHASKPPVPDPGAYVAALNGLDPALRARLAPDRAAAAQVPRAAAVAAALHERSAGSRVVAASLAVTREDGLVWLVAVDPAGGVRPMSLPAFYVSRRPAKRPTANLDVIFVDARTGRVTGSIKGQSALLPPLPYIPLPKR